MGVGVEGAESVTAVLAAGGTSELLVVADVVDMFILDLLSDTEMKRKMFWFVLKK